mgnify:CR=1 FL=1
MVITQDLAVPKIRVGTLEQSLPLEEGQKITLESGLEDPGGGAIPTTYAKLARDLSSGDNVLLDDGKIELRVREWTASRCPSNARLRMWDWSNGKP